MSAVKRLLQNYERQVNLPWSLQTSGKQRVWFAVYPPAEERRIRANLPEFETATLQAKHGWTSVDLTRVFPEFLGNHRYREQIFKDPHLFRAGTDLEVRAEALIKQACAGEEANSRCVVAVTGLATLFDFIRVSSLVDRVEDAIRGRLLIFFPGEYSGNVYRFMDARDGFNYMAVPITSTESFMTP